ncbi:hypothetical protein SAMN05216281_1147 [Cryobacterium luteum]|nr:hypothetical protein SAMN05216281_1147 [Cryobacterium luteum]
MTPVSMAIASSRGRHACLPVKPQTTVSTSTIIGSATGPKTMASPIMTTVRVGDRLSTSHSRTGES